MQASVSTRTVFSPAHSSGAQHGRSLAHEEETLRWPTHLDREAIEKRLVEACDAARAQKLGSIVALLSASETLPAARLAANIVAALSWLQEKPQYRYITMQLEMVALNLRNLK